jgi:hypothetical protein
MMKVRLLRDARINHKAGEVVEVSPAEYGFLIDVGSAEAVKDKVEAVESVSDTVEAEPKKTVKAASVIKKATRKK